MLGGLGTAVVAVVTALPVVAVLLLRRSPFTVLAVASIVLVAALFYRSALHQQNRGRFWSSSPFSFAPGASREVALDAGDAPLGAVPHQVCLSVAAEHAQRTGVRQTAVALAVREGGRDEALLQETVFWERLPLLPAWAGSARAWCAPVLLAGEASLALHVEGGDENSHGRLTVVPADGLGLRGPVWLQVALLVPIAIGTGAVGVLVGIGGVVARRRRGANPREPANPRPS